MLSEHLAREARWLVSRRLPLALTAARDFQYRRRYNDRTIAADAERILRQASDLDSGRPEYGPDAAPVPLRETRRHAVLEINNTCNIDCLMCKTSLATRKKGKISEGTLRVLLDRLQEEGVETVALHTIGDPLSNPRLQDVFDELRKRKMRAGISTNGLLLHRYVKLFQTYRDVCSLIRFSIDGATKETYEKIRFGGKWEPLLENLEIARTEIGNVGTSLEVAMVVSKDNIHEVGAFIERFRDVVRHPARDMSFGPINSLSPDMSYFNAVNLFPQFTHPNANCHFMSAGVVFGHIDGEFSICCRDYDGSLRIGDLTRNSVSEIRHGEALAKIREDYFSRKFESLPQCADCYRVDGRVSGIFSTFIKLMLYHRPHEPAAYYQARVDRLMEILNGNPPHQPALRELVDETV